MPFGCFLLFFCVGWKLKILYTIPAVTSYSPPKRKPLPVLSKLALVRVIPIERLTARFGERANLFCIPPPSINVLAELSLLEENPNPILPLRAKE